MIAVLLKWPRSEKYEISRLIRYRIDWGVEKELYIGTIGMMVFPYALHTLLL